MDPRQEAFYQELLADFRTEAAEHHLAIVNGLLRLEQNPEGDNRQSLIESTFRELHSLKGAARAVNLIDIERLCQSMETVFHALKEGKLNLVPEFFTTFFQVTDFLQVMLSVIGKTEKNYHTGEIKSLQRSLERCLTKGSLSQQASLPEVSGIIIPPPPAYQSETPQVDRFEPGSRPVLPADHPTSSETIRLSVRKLQTIFTQAEELITSRSTLQTCIHDLEALHPGEEALIRLSNRFSRLHRSLSRTIDSLITDIRQTLLMPFSTILDLIPKLVRDLANAQGKEVTVQITGKETELDKRILEEIKDPLIHLIRNCIDHGIEPPDIRRGAGKSSAGTLTITVRQKAGQQVEIRIQDDGGGLNREKITKAAVRQGSISADLAGDLSDQEVYSLIFRSGISTSTLVSDLSGRGLGMAIVMEKVLKLGGTVTVDSQPGTGTSFTLLFPVNLATFRGIPVKIQDQVLIIPTTLIEQAIRFDPSEVKTIEGKPAIRLHDRMISLIYLHELLGIPFRYNLRDPAGKLVALVTGQDPEQVAFMVDEILGEEEGIVKDLTPLFGHLRFVSGAIILGNGRIVPVMNIPELTASVIQRQEGIPGEEVLKRLQAEQPDLPKILVAEDSLTARSLMRNILESSGYIVKTAVDGAEALQCIRDESFDLVVSDVEMPRMNGFDLTAAIRSDTKAHEIPVILVTALETADDRRKGMEAGANAYINKSSFEQDRLLETIQRLI